MAKIVLYMSMSLDGFITGPDDGLEQPMGIDGHRLHDWLADGEGDPRSYRPSAAPSAMVFDELMATGAVIAGRRTFDLAGRLEWRPSLLHGANTAQECLRAGLLDEMEIQLMPVLLGEGRRLFEHLRPEHIELELTRVLEAPGVTHLRYRQAQTGTEA
jgi:dihydrofolate reductase